LQPTHLSVRGIGLILPRLRDFYRIGAAMLLGAETASSIPFQLADWDYGFAVPVTVEV
jgi:hypothetical protein